MKDLVARLKEIRADHLRLASWNAGKGRAARVAFHHDAAAAIASAIAELRRGAGAGAA